VFFLDEPTSGLDPATGAELLRVLRRLADAGSTVLLTTHAPQDLVHCDRVVFLARGGHLAFSGSVEDACRHFRVERVEEIYERLTEDTPQGWAHRSPEDRPAWVEPPAPVPAVGGQIEPGPTFAREWAVLSRRTAETLVRNRLTLAILIGSPAMVVAMIAVLFRPGAFEPATVKPSAVAMILFWIAFGAFFFGLTYGLLQIVTERAILRREHLAGQRLGAYLLSKVAVLLPFLVLVVVLMLGVLRLLDRLPVAGATTYLGVGVSLLLGATAALLLGLWTSAAVRNPSQATLALPMLCFPAVLFSGAILPVAQMAAAGAAISVVTPDRWVFEALGHEFAIRRLLLDGGSSLGPPLVRSYGDAGSAASTTYWLYLVAFCAVFFVGARLTLDRAVRRADR
jgi:hypothetical protein